MFSVKYWVRATEEFPVVSEDDMLLKSIDESSESRGSPRPMRICTAKASGISRESVKSGCAREWGG